MLPSPPRSPLPPPPVSSLPPLTLITPAIVSHLNLIAGLPLYLNPLLPPSGAWLLAPPLLLASWSLCWIVAAFITVLLLYLLPVWVCLPVLTALLAGWSLPFMQSVNQVSTHHFILCKIWNIPYVILHNTRRTAGNLSSSLFRPSQLHSFHSFPLSLSICVARSKHRSVFDHALSKQMSYFLRRADEGDGSPRICDASAQLKRLKQSQRRQKISDGRKINAQDGHLTCAEGLSRR